MSSVIPTTFQRRPALIPPDVHLSSEDERSLCLRIGNLQLALLEDRAVSSEYNPIHSFHCSGKATPQRSRIDKATNTKSIDPTQGLKRKASTTVEEYEQLIYTVHKTLVSEPDVRDLPMTEDRAMSCTATCNSARAISRVNTSKVTFLESENQSLSPKNHAATALHDTSFHSR